MLTLHDNRGSTNALKVRFLLHELGLAAALVDVPLDEKPDSYLALHPFGLVPTLVDDDVVVTESNSALRYLAEREGRADLRGATPAERARIDCLLDSLSLEVRPALWGAEAGAIYGHPETPGWREALDRALDGYERMLAPDGHATGPFTIADCAIAGRMLHLPELPVDLARWPRLARVLRLATDRPAFRAAV
jgi:glutathione S-transferase